MVLHAAALPGLPFPPSLRVPFSLLVVTSERDVCGGFLSFCSFVRGPKEFLQRAKDSHSETLVTLRFADLWPPPRFFLVPPLSRICIAAPPLMRRVLFPLCQGRILLYTLRVLTTCCPPILRPFCLHRWFSFLSSTILPTLLPLPPPSSPPLPLPFLVPLLPFPYSLFLPPSRFSLLNPPVCRRVFTTPCLFSRPLLLLLPFFPFCTHQTPLSQPHYFPLTLAFPRLPCHLT